MPAEVLKVELEDQQGQSLYFIFFERAEKKKESQTKAAIRFVPVMYRISEELLLKACQAGFTTAARKNVANFLEKFSLPGVIPKEENQTRRFSGSLLLWYLTQARWLRYEVFDKELVVLHWLNVALGHLPHSNQWAAYIYFLLKKEEKKKEEKEEEKKKEEKKKEEKEEDKKEE